MPEHDEQVVAGVRQRWAIPAAGFILFVGGADPRKNHRVFLQAVARSGSQLGGRALVLAGDCGTSAGKLPGNRAGARVRSRTSGVPGVSTAKISVGLYSCAICLSFLHCMRDSACRS